MSAQRVFMPKLVPAEAGKRRVHRITCSQCGTENDISANTFSGSRATEDLLRIWQRAGWTIGRNQSRDLCADCAKARRLRTDKPSPDHTAEIIPMAQPVLVPDPPRDMTRDDRRIIFAKLSDVYLDEASGYSGGWTDKRVADDLGVPRAWVETIREENFGPVRSNEDIAALTVEWRGIRSDLAAAEQRSKDLAAEAGKVREVMRGLSERADRIERRIGAIERAVQP